MSTENKIWPSRDEYDQALMRWTQTIWDEELRNGTLDRDKMGIRRYGGANLYTCIYRIGDWMVRCFCTKPPQQVPTDIEARYKAIARFCEANSRRVSSLLPITYIDKGITINGHMFPIVKMPFLKGYSSLGEFVLEHYQDNLMMERLSDAWLRMIAEMEGALIAHGDLDITNVFVQISHAGIVLKLIDYDNIWIPELNDHRQTELGHIHFQHPAFLRSKLRPYNVEMDRFSALTVYISLKMLVTHPELYDAWGADESDRLLFSAQDYENAGLADSHIKQLHALAEPFLHPYIDELIYTLHYNRMPKSMSSFSDATTRINRRTVVLQTPITPAIANWSKAVNNAANTPVLAPVKTSMPISAVSSHPISQPLTPLQHFKMSQPVNNLPIHFLPPPVTEPIVQRRSQIKFLDMLENTIEELGVPLFMLTFLLIAASIVLVIFMLLLVFGILAFR